MPDEIKHLPGGWKLTIFDRGQKRPPEPLKAQAVLIRPVPLLSKMQHLRRDLLTWAATGAKLVPKEKRKENLAICAACQYWNPKGNAGLGECQYPKCGCTKIKAALVGMECPIKKWSNKPTEEKVLPTPSAAP